MWPMYDVFEGHIEMLDSWEQGQYHEVDGVRVLHSRGSDDFKRSSADGICESGRIRAY